MENLELNEELEETDSPYEHLELTEYIRAFRSSADRVRWVTFIMTVFAAVIFVYTWNGGDSWMAHRYTTLRDLKHRIDLEDKKAEQNKSKAKKADSREEVNKNDSQEKRDLAVRTRVGNIASEEELGAMVDKLRELRVERLMMFDLPWLGVSIDFNDVVVFAGLTFILLFALLLLSLTRHHENLYLALYKVRRLAKVDRNMARGESKANFLYHALAMAQVLSYPPTLARWSARWQHSFVYGLLFIPFLLETYITWTNWTSRGLAPQYGLGAYIPLQVTFCLILLAFAIACVIYAKAANARWKSAFLHVNAARRYIAPPPWRVWTRLSWKERQRPTVERALLAELTEGAELRRFIYRATIDTTHTVPRSDAKKRFTFNEQEVFAKAIHSDAFATIAARVGTKAFRVIDHEVVDNVLATDRWSIEIRWTVECDDQHFANGVCDR